MEHIEPSTRRVLLVEDEPILRLNLAEELRDAGFVVIEAATGDEAWAYLDAAGHVDLVFSDVHMPGGINGIELHRRVRLKFPNIKTILTSGNLGSSTSEAEIFLPKPYSLAKAVQASTQLLNERG